MSLSSIFGRFTGRPVGILERDVDLEGEPWTLYQPDENDPVLAELKQVAAGHGLTVRMLLPGMYDEPAGRRNDRVCVPVEKDANGVWRVGRDFVLG